MKSEKFKSGISVEVARRLGRIADAEAEVEKALRPENIKIEVKDETGRWKGTRNV